ncbi:MAG: hypothetical protein AB1646_01800 [Thermodesulfobacteriota bacterium]
MGLVLDEPRDGDESHTIEDVPIVADAFAMKVIREYGGIDIRQSHFGPTAELHRPDGQPAAECGC